MDGHISNVCFVTKCPILGESVCERLTDNGFQVDWLYHPQRALEKIQTIRYDAVLSDLSDSDMNGADFLKTLISSHSHMPPALFITPHDELEQAVNLLKLGAVDFISRPLDLEMLNDKLNSICHKDVKNGRQHLSQPLGVSSYMLELEEKVQLLSPFNQTPILITGESGVGKEVLARRLHDSQNTKAPFVAINCAAIPETLLESELFGHEKGAFSGAANLHKGVFEQANGGTLLLDEIGEIPHATQVKLLRVIQEQTIVRVGGEQSYPIKLRIICATNCDLQQRVSDGEFRQDLYYRIKVIELYVPPLRERRDDICWLTKRFVDTFLELYPTTHKKLNDSAKRLLLDYHWPGNVRELKHTIERAFILTRGHTISAKDLMLDKTLPSRESSNTLKIFLRKQECNRITAALHDNNWNINQTASELDICRKALWEKMKRLNIIKPPIYQSR